MNAHRGQWIGELTGTAVVHAAAKPVAPFTFSSSVARHILRIARVDDHHGSSAGLLCVGHVAVVLVVVVDVRVTDGREGRWGRVRDRWAERRSRGRIRRRRAENRRAF